MVSLRKCSFKCLVWMCLLQVGWSKFTELTSGNIDDILKNNELVMVNFYANWCRFSQMLVPIYNEAAERVKQEFSESGKVVLGAVDCDREGAIAARYAVNKYPTLKIFRYGELVRKEYRGQRSSDALLNFIREQLRNTVQVIQHTDELEGLDRKKRHVIGYFDNEHSADYAVFKTIAGMLREDCQFVASFGASSQPANKVIFRPSGVDVAEVVYPGPLSDQELFQKWATEKCVPLVREITFENAEELTEEGLPFVILFHDPSDTVTPEKYREVVARDLYTEKYSVNFLTADGHKFAHPLAHIGKSAKDLPVILIDSFRHMYLWPHDPGTHIEQSHLLKTFIADLNSGKLHREFHHGPDPVQQNQQGGETAPPESVFKNLAPSHNRYTLLRDEL